MCMLTFFPEGVQPDPEALKNGAEYNNDGHGFAIVNGKRLIIQHGMDSEYVIAEFVRLRAKHPHGPALFHSRIATGGVVNEFNCHPFRIGGDHKTVLGHNGILPKLVQPEDGDKRCDTRITAEVLMNGMNLGNAKVRGAIGEWIGKANKFVILTTNPRYEKNAYIINEDVGVWHEGIWYSNHDYEGYKWQKYATIGRKGLWWEEEEKNASKYGYASSERCWQCTSYNVDSDRNMCLDCGVCLDCGDSFDNDCQCYLYLASRQLDENEPEVVQDYEPEPTREREPAGMWSMD